VVIKTWRKINTKKTKTKQNDFQIQVVHQTDAQMERFVQSSGVEDMVVVYLVTVAKLVIFLSFFFLEELKVLKHEKK